MASNIIVALPSLTNRCGPRGINFTPPTNASLVAFDENCDTAFIGPPSVGTIHVDHGMGSTNLLFCDTVKILPEIIEASRAGMKVWADRLKQKSTEYDEIAKEVSAYEKSLADLEPSLAAKKKRLLEKEDDLNNARNQLTEVKERLKDCISSSVAINECNTINDELAKIKQLVELKRGIVSDIKLEIIDLDYKIKSAEGNIEEINERLIKITAALETYKRLLTGLENDALDGYKRYGQLYGATTSVTFRANWQTLLLDAQQKNPRLDLSIQQLPLLSSAVSITSSIPEGFSVQNMAILLGARVPGFEFYPSPKEPQKINLERDISFNPVSWTTDMAGQLDFNLVGACGMTDSTSQFLLAKARETVGAMLAVNLKHTFPMMMKRSYEITFNATKIASEIEKVAESGGFLSAKKIHELTQSNFKNDTFKIIFDDEGGHTRYSDAEKAQITTDTKYEIFDQVLRGMNATPQFSPDRLPPPRLDRSTGARFIYENLPCFGYAICYATGFLIGVADALFGSTEAVTKFKEVNQTTVTHKYRATSPGYYMVNTTFGGKAN